MSFLQELCESSRDRCQQARAEVPLERLVAQARSAPIPPPLRLSDGGFDVIAEVKKTSPADGDLSRETDIALIDRAVAYAHAGAAAVSVLTEPTRFKGKLIHLQSIAEALRPLGVPAMRKDFITDVYQVWEAAAAGAGGVLLIIRTLDDPGIMEMLEAASQTRMFVLLEAFDRDDLLRAHPFTKTHDNVLVGLNSRDLSTLKVDRSRLTRLAKHFPLDCLRVAESGLSTPQDTADMRDAGYQLGLVGTALMRRARPRELIVEMLKAARD